MRALIFVGIVILVGCKKPEGTSPAELKPDTPAGPAEFSTTDPEASLRWMVAKRKEAFAAIPEGNELAKKEASEKLDTVLNSVIGKSVRWPVKVASVDSSRQVRLQFIIDRTQPSSEPAPEPTHLFRATLEVTPSIPKGLVGEPTAFDGPKEPWLSSVREDQQLILEGVVSQVSPQGFLNFQKKDTRITQWLFKVRLSDTKFSKP